jgi:hypothetical protein
MCTGLEWLAVGLTAASTVSSIVGQQQAQQAQEAAVARARQIAQQEEARQKQMREQAQQMHQKTVQQHGREQYDQGLQQEATRLEEAYQPSGTETTLADTMLSGQNLGTDIVKDDAAKQMAGAVNEAKQRAASLAKLSAYGEVATGRQLGRQETGNQLDVLNNLRRGGLTASQFGQQAIMNNLPQYRPSPLSTLLSAGASLASFGAGLGAGTNVINPAGAAAGTSMFSMPGGLMQTAPYNPSLWTSMKAGMGF